MPTKVNLEYLAPAVSDFEEIVKYHITRLGAPNARKIYNAMESGINRLSEFPLLGQTIENQQLLSKLYIGRGAVMKNWDSENLDDYAAFWEAITEDAK